jgi:hypothetical protein
MKAAERRALWVIRIAGTAVLVLFGVFQVVNPKAPVHANPPGFRDPVAGFELAGTPDDVFGILGRPGEAARAEAVRRMEAGTRLDFLFLLAYPAFHVGIALLLGARGTAPRPAVAALVALSVVMALGDALENRQLLRLAGTVEPAAMAGDLLRLRAFTLAKWYALFAASAIVAVLVRREAGWWRWSAPFFGLGALLGFASAVHLPAIEWSIAPTAVAWGMTYVRAFARTPAEGARPRHAT